MKFQTKIKIFFMFISIFLLVGSVSAELIYQHLTLQAVCAEENIIVKIRGDKNITGTYFIENCTLSKTNRFEDFHRCKCYNQQFVGIHLNNDYNISYDIVIDYYIEKVIPVTDKIPGQINPSPIEMANEKNKRTETFNNIYAKKQIVYEKEKRSFFENFNTGQAGMFLGMGLFVVFILILVSVIWTIKILKEDKQEESFIPKKDNGINNTQLKEYVEKYKKYK